MLKYTIDYANLENSIYKKAYRLDEVKDKIVKVAFDIVRFKDDDNRANLWQVQNSDDGDYIIAMYEPEEENEKVVNSWNVKVNKSAGILQVSYKGDPIVSLASNKLGIPTNELSDVESYLPEKLASNKKLVKYLLNELNESVRNNVITKYPELV
jgi:hypothetical protein